MQATIDKMNELTAKLNTGLKPSRVSPGLLAALDADPLNEGEVLARYGIGQRLTCIDCGSDEGYDQWISDVDTLCRSCLEARAAVPTTEDRQEMLKWQLEELAPNGQFETGGPDGPFVVRQPIGLGGWLLWINGLEAKRFESAEALAAAILETEAGQ